MFSFDRASEELDAILYASTVRGIVMYHALHLKTLVSYGDIASVTKTMPKGGQLAQALARIAEDDHAAGRLPSTAVVISEQDKIPGTGFFKQCRELGMAFEDTPGGRLAFWRNLLNRMDIKPDLSPLFDILGEQYNGEEIATLASMWHTLPDDWVPSETIVAKAVIPTDEDLEANKDTKVIDPYKTIYNTTLTGDNVDEVISRAQRRSATQAQLTQSDLTHAQRRAQELLAQKGYIFVPPQSLKEGDVILLSEGGKGARTERELKVDSVRIIFTADGGESRAKEVLWTADGREYISPAVGMHLKVKRSAPTPTPAPTVEVREAKAGEVSIDSPELTTNAAVEATVSPASQLPNG